MAGNSSTLRLVSALGVCATLACSLAIASPAASAGSPAPDPSPGPTPDPYTTTTAAPAHVAIDSPAVLRPVAPATRTAHVAVPSHAQVTVKTPAAARVHSAPRPKAIVPADPPAQPIRTTRTGPVRSFSASVATAVETTHRVSRTLAFAVALLVLLSGAFVLTAAREVAR